MCVSFGQTGRHLIDDGDLLRERERLLLPKKGRQGRALEKLHHEKGGVAFLEQLVHRDDVRVLKLPRGLRLLQESFPKLSLVGRIRDRHRLDCHGATEPRVDGAIDHAHGAAADETAHRVPADLVGNDNFGHQFGGGFVYGRTQNPKLLAFNRSEPRILFTFWSTKMSPQRRSARGEENPGRDDLRRARRMS